MGGLVQEPVQAMLIRLWPGATESTMPAKHLSDNEVMLIAEKTVEMVEAADGSFMRRAHDRQN